MGSVFTDSSANPATASLGALTYMPTTTATTNGTTFAMSQNMVGIAPDAVGGQLFQNAFNTLSLSFTAGNTGGIYGYLITDTYSQGFSLANNSALANHFTQLFGYSDLTVTLTDVTQGISNVQTFNFLTSENDNLKGSALANFAFSQANAQDFNYLMEGVGAGDAFTLDILLDSKQYGTSASAVPLPPTVLLFGSGLAGFFLLGKRRLFRQ